MDIILAGPGRSGTTLFNKLFCFHPEFAWISGWVNKYPEQAWLSKFNSIYQNQFLNINWAGVKFSPKPAEAYGYWNYYFKPFTSKNTHPNQQNINNCKTNIQKIKSYSNKKHFVTKITGETRFDILKAVFNKDLLYLWIERDPRVVVSSYIKQKWGYKTDPDGFSKLSNEDKIRLNVKRYMGFYSQSLEVNKKLLFYEDLCENPVTFFDKLFTDLDIELTKEQIKIISSWDIKPVGWESHYKKNYSVSEQELFNDLLAEPLKAYNYL